MNDYRTDVRDITKETNWTFWKILPVFIMIIIIMFAVIFGLKSLGLIGSTIVEREIFKQSFQYKESMEQRAAILEANISEINIMLQSNPANRQDLLNQKRILTVQLKAITINQ